MMEQGKGRAARDSFLSGNFELVRMAGQERLASNNYSYSPMATLARRK